MSNVSRHRWCAGHAFTGAQLGDHEIDFVLPGRNEIMTAAEMARIYERKSPETAAEEATLNVLRLVIARIDGEEVGVRDLAGDALAERLGGMSTVESLRDSIDALTTATDGEVNFVLDSLEEAEGGHHYIKLPTGELEGVDRRWRWASVKLPKHSTIRKARAMARRQNGRGSGVVEAELLYCVVRLGLTGIEPYTPQPAGDPEARDDASRMPQDCVVALKGSELAGNKLDDHLSPREQSCLVQFLAMASTSSPRVQSDFLESLERGAPGAS